MNILAIRISYFLSGLLVVTSLTMQGANGSSTSADDKQSQEHLSDLMAKITLADGSTQIVILDGIGCTESLCSTVLMKARTATSAMVEIWFESIAAIRNIRQNEAVFVTRDGSERRLTFVSDFRVLYVSREGGAKRKIDLAKIKSLEILGGGH
jgi:hypothetical protein